MGLNALTDTTPVAAPTSTPATAPEVKEPFNKSDTLTQRAEKRAAKQQRMLGSVPSAPAAPAPVAPVTQETDPIAILEAALNQPAETSPSATSDNQALPNPYEQQFSQMQQSYQQMQHQLHMQQQQYAQLTGYLQAQANYQQQQAQQAWQAQQQQVNPNDPEVMLRQRLLEVADQKYSPELAAVRQELNQFKQAQAQQAQQYQQQQQAARDTHIQNDLISQARSAASEQLFKDMDPTLTADMQDTGAKLILAHAWANNVPVAQAAASLQQTILKLGLAYVKSKSGPVAAKLKAGSAVPAPGPVGQQGNESTGGSIPKHADLVAAGFRGGALEWMQAGRPPIAIKR